MLVRRYGERVQSVVMNFDPLAMTEIAFRRTSDLSIRWSEFVEGYEKIGEESLVASAEGDVKVDSEQALLDELQAQVEALQSGLADGALLMVESQPGHDYPKLRDRTKVRVVGGLENRLHFTWTVDPPLRLGLYRKR